MMVLQEALMCGELLVEQLSDGAIVQVYAGEVSVRGI